MNVDNGNNWYDVRQDQMIFKQAWLYLFLCDYYNMYKCHHEENLCSRVYLILKEVPIILLMQKISEH